MQTERERRPHGADMATTIALSIIIPAYQAEKTIGAQLEAIADQVSALNNAPVAWEIIVGDNGSSDATRLVAERFSPRLPIRVIDASARRGPGAARNIAAQAALGRVFVFTDADDVVMEGWLAAWMHWVSDTSNRSFAGGPIRHSQETGSNHAPSGCAAPVQMGLPYASANNLGITSALFAQLGGFDETLNTGEDIDLSWRALEAGAEVECVPATLRVASGRLGWATVRRYFEYGLSDPWLYSRHRDLGPVREEWRSLAKTYVGLVARIPFIFQRQLRERWLRQLGRRAGRLVGSLRCGVWFP
jgi:GT2 family glycosyltransferase